MDGEKLTPIVHGNLSWPKNVIRAEIMRAVFQAGSFLAMRTSSTRSRQVRTGRFGWFLTDKVFWSGQAADAAPYSPINAAASCRSGKAKPSVNP